MDTTDSPYGSGGGDSGWTLYLDQSSVSRSQCHSFGGFVGGYGGNKGSRDEFGEEEEEEDSSMVSDASSGRRHYIGEEDEEEGGRGRGQGGYLMNRNGFYCNNPSGVEASKKSKNNHKIKQQHSCLDDTASSPVLGFSKRNFNVSQNEGSMEHVLDFSQGFSATHYKGKSTLSKKLGFFQSSIGGKQASEEQGGIQRSKWK